MLRNISVSYYLKEKVEVIPQPASILWIFFPITKMNCGDPNLTLVSPPSGKGTFKVRGEQAPWLRLMTNNLEITRVRIEPSLNSEKGLCHIFKRFEKALYEANPLRSQSGGEKLRLQS